MRQVNSLEEEVVAGSPADVGGWTGLWPECFDPSGVSDFSTRHPGFRYATRG